MTVKLVLENLKHRPMRSLLSILLIGVPVTLILSLVGLTHGMLEDSQHRAARRRRRHHRARRPALRWSTFSGPPRFPKRWSAKIEKQPHVALAMGVITHTVDLPLAVIGIDLAKFNRMSGGFTYVDGGTLRGPDDILVDRSYAGAEARLNVGDTLNLMNHHWHVAGIVEGGKLARLVVPLETLQDLDARTGKVSQIYVKVDNPANIEPVLDELKTGPSELQHQHHGGLHRRVQRRARSTGSRSSSW